MNDNKRPFRGLKVPEPPEGMRHQVLDRAREALAREPRLDIWSRIWESRTARLAWGTSVLALAVGHLAVPTDGPAPAMEPSVLASAESTKHEELADIIDLPRLSLDAHPMTALGERAPEAETVAEENES